MMMYSMRKLHPICTKYHMSWPCWRWILYFRLIWLFFRRSERLVCFKRTLVQVDAIVFQKILEPFDFRGT